MATGDLEHAVELGLRLTRAAVGLGVSLALAPVRLALRAVMPPPPEPRWAPTTAEPFAPVAPIAPVTPVTPVTAGDSARVPEPEPHAGPGPEIHVEPPWPDYDDMTVTAVLARLRGADPAVVAMARLYEETHKRRRGVLGATE